MRGEFGRFAQFQQFLKDPSYVWQELQSAKHDLSHITFIDFEFDEGRTTVIGLTLKNTGIE
jgi:hypothetical protein